MALSVLCVIPDMRTGGAERQMALILNHLQRKEFSVKLCLFNQDGELLSALPRDLQIYDLGKRSRWSIGSLVLKLSRLIRKEKPDVLYSRLQYANAIASLAIRVSGKRVKHVAHEATILSQHLSELRRGRVLKLWIRKMYSAIDCLVAPSEVSRQDLISEFGIPGSRVSVIYNSVELESLAGFHMPDSVKRGAPGSGPKLISVGSLRPIKGHRFLLRALKEVLKSYPECRLEILGEGSERDSLTRYAKELGIESHVHMPGIRTPYAAVANADIFVLPSLREGMPGALLEALALRVPVIASSVGGVPEVVLDGKNGFLVRPGDWEQISDRILDLLRDRRKRDEFAAAGPLVVSEKFNILNNVRQLERIFLGLNTNC